MKEAKRLLTVVVGESRRQELVEDVVVTLSRLLERNSRLLEQVRLNIGTGDLATRTEVNTNEFTLKYPWRKKEEEKKERKKTHVYNLILTNKNKIVILSRDFIL